ncbi:MAG: histidinol-phosphatase HisJ [Deltaproteobacteria bacterium]|nr:histidinol-phosphatase HisJ [Deltaproteobacteria bacterium]
MTKWDSHTHSQFCKHGTGEKTALLVEKAIELGFTKYSISEHAPLPEELMPDPVQRSEFTLLESEVGNYFSLINELKRQYGDRIEILSGMEIDYLSGFEQYTIDLIKTYQNELDDLIISLHCIEGKGGLRSIDYTPDDFKDGLLDYYGSINKVYNFYWETMGKMLQTDLGYFKTRRIGHIGLINKFSRNFPWVSDDMTTPAFFENIFTLVKSNGWTLEFNAAGLNKSYSGNMYLTEPMLYWCNKLNIDIFYGSDAHGVDMVGRHYDTYLDI